MQLKALYVSTVKLVSRSWNEEKIAASHAGTPEQDQAHAHFSA
jgi:hypothetical protein